MRARGYIPSAIDDWGEIRVRTHRGKVLVLMVTAALGAGACGSDEPRLTKDQFIERGNVFCAEASQRIEEAARGAFANQGEIPSDEEINDFATDVVAPTLENEVERLSELRPPEIDEERIEDLLQAGRDGVDTVRQDPGVIVSSADDGFGRYQELADAYGLENCGGGSDVTRDALEGIVR